MACNSPIAEMLVVLAWSLSILYLELQKSHKGTPNTLPLAFSYDVAAFVQFQSKPWHVNDLLA